MHSSSSRTTSPNVNRALLDDFSASNGTAQEHITSTQQTSPLLPDHNDMNLCEAENEDESEPIKIEVSFDRRHNEDFELVELPPLNR